MITRLYIFIILFLAAASAGLAQDSDIEEDSVIDLKNLPPPETIFNDIFNFYMDKGWFASPQPGVSGYGVGVSFGDVYDKATAITPSGFVNTGHPYTSRRLLAYRDMKTMKPRTQELVDDYPETGLFAIDFNKYGSLSPIGCLYRIGFGLQSQSGLLFSLDKSKKYLNFRNEKNNFKEAGVVVLDEWHLTGKFGLMKPIYGVFLKSEDQSLISQYYFAASFLATYSFYSHGMQYSQIADAKKYLRYSSGSDTLRLQDNVVFKGLDRFRSYVEFSVGFQILSTFGLLYELYFDLPVTSILNDAYWKQNLLGFRIEIQWED